jgi:hypothetical protein
LDFDLFDGVIQRAPTGQIVAQLFVADAAGGFFGKAAGVVAEAANLFNEARVDHGFDAGIDAAAEDVLFPLDAEEEGVHGGVGGIPLGLEGGDGCAGEAEDFQRANDAAEVIGMNASGGGGIDGGKFSVKGGGTLLFGAGGQFRTKGFVRTGSFEQAIDECAEIEDGAANDNQSSAFKLGFFQLRAGVGDEAGGGVDVPGIGDIKHEVGGVGPGLGCGLGGADVHAAVNLHGIGGHNGQRGPGAAVFSFTEAVGERFGEVAFAGGGAAEDDDGLVHGWTISQNRYFARGLIEAAPFLYDSWLYITKGREKMARPGDNYQLRWRSKKANKGRKPSKGRVKGWSTKHYPHLYA